MRIAVRALVALSFVVACGSPAKSFLGVSDPSDLSVTAGQAASFSVSASNAHAPTFQWYEEQPTGDRAIDGATAATFTIASAQPADAGRYYVVVDDGGAEVKSRSAMLTVVATGSPPAITQQPAAVAVDVGGTASFSVVATGDPAPTYQWYTTTGPIAGATGASFSIASVALTDAGGYYVVATNTYGSAQSDTATLTVDQSGTPPTITQQPTTAQVTVGHATSLTVAASGSGPLAYQWYRYVDGTNDTPLGTGTSLDVASAALSDAGTYYVVVTNAYGSATSAHASILVYPKATLDSFVMTAQIPSIAGGYTLQTVTSAYKHDYIWFSMSFTGTQASVGVNVPGWTPVTYSTSVSMVPLITDVTQSYTFTIAVKNAIGDSDSYQVQLPMSPAGWTPSAATMSTPRYGHTATLLADGTVLVAGGLAMMNTGNALATAEIYDPAKDKFTPTGNLTAGRTGHTATLLADGRVLLTGGLPKGAANVPTTALSSAEIYDPATGMFTATGSMSSARIGHTATLLDDGTVLIAGGTTGVWFDSNLSIAGTMDTTAELFDPKANGGKGAFTTIASVMPDPISAGVAVKLADGRVLVAGGNYYTGSSAGPSYGDVYDPAAKTFTRASTNLAYHMGGRAAARMQDGRVLVTEGEADGGGFQPPYLADVEIFTPGSPGSFAAAAPEVQWQRAWATLTPLADGTLLLAHGNALGYGTLTDGVRYDPATNTWSRRGYLNSNVPRAMHTATLLPDGRVLIVGGYQGGATINQDAELFRAQ
jgi:hypothetical protein